MTRLSANASPFARTATYSHQIRPRVNFGGVTAARYFDITPEERSVRFWAWDRGGMGGESKHKNSRPYKPVVPKTKIQLASPEEATPFVIPSEPMPENLKDRVSWRNTHTNLVRQKTNKPEYDNDEFNGILREIYALSSTLINNEETIANLQVQTDHAILDSIFKQYNAPCNSVSNMLPRQYAWEAPDYYDDGCDELYG